MNILQDIPKLPNYLELLDEEVKQVYEGKTYMNFEPLLYQLHLDLKRFGEAVKLERHTNLES